MPCLGPLTRREQWRLLVHARALRVAVAVLLGFALLNPAPQPTPAPPPVDVLAIGQCPAPDGEVTADVGSPDGGVARGGRLPERFPDEWMKAPCPEGQNMRTVRGRCFVSTGQPPPCSIGHEHHGECLLALTGAKPTPNAIQR
jgi:hypothetical protein